MKLPYSEIKQIGILTTIPVLLVTGPLVGFFIGSWLDRKTGFDPWLAVIFILLGITASGKQVSRLIRLVQKEGEKR